MRRVLLKEHHLKKQQMGFTATELIIVIVGLLAIFGAWGWVWNIVKIVGSDFAQITGMLVMRIVGIFIAPLGAILGFF